MPPIDSASSPTWPSAAPFMQIAVLAIVSGGLIAAAVAHAPTPHAVWLVAYLVLVVGVAQFALGAGQAWLAAVPSSARLRAGECLLFNAGNALVIAGTLWRHVAWVIVGALLLVAALGLFFRGVRRARGGLWLYAYRTLLVLLGASALVGVLLATWRAYR